MGEGYHLRYHPCPGYDTDRIPADRKGTDIRHFSAVFLSGEPCADGEAVQPCPGICRTYRAGDRLGFVLWHWYDFSLPGRKRRKGLWGGSDTPGD